MQVDAAIISCPPEWERDDPETPNMAPSEHVARPSSRTSSSASLAPASAAPSSAATGVQLETMKAEVEAFAIQTQAACKHAASICKAAMKAFQETESRLDAYMQTLRNRDLSRPRDRSRSRSRK